MSGGRVRLPVRAGGARGGPHRHVPVRLLPRRRRLLGVPDFGYLTQTEMAEVARRVCHAVPDSTRDRRRRHRLRQRAQHHPHDPALRGRRRRRHLPRGPGVAEAVRAHGRQAGGAAARTGWPSCEPRSTSRDELFVVARTDARAAVDLDEACARAQAAAELGVDAIFVEAPESVEELEAIAAATPGCVRVANMIEGGRTPLRSPDGAARARLRPHRLAAHRAPRRPSGDGRGVRRAAAPRGHCESTSSS